MITLFEDFESENYIASEDDFNLVEPGDVLIAKGDIYITKPYMCPKKLSFSSLDSIKLFAKKGSKKIAKKPPPYVGGRIHLNGFNGNLYNDDLAKFFTIKDKNKIEYLKNMKKFNL